MTAAVVAKCHCTNMLAILDNKAKAIAEQKKLWKRRLAMNIKAMERFAFAKAKGGT